MTDELRTKFTDLINLLDTTQNEYFTEYLNLTIAKDDDNASVAKETSDLYENVRQEVINQLDLVKSI